MSNNHKNSPGNAQQLSREAKELAMAVKASAQNKMEALLLESRQALTHALDASHQFDHCQKRSAPHTEAEAELSNIELVPGVTWQDYDLNNPEKMEHCRQQGMHSINQFNDQVWENLKSSTAIANDPHPSLASSTANIAENSKSMLDSILNKLEQSRQDSHEQ